ncbi:MAG: sulfatase-like hydrolase/transferase, partial [Ferruginibacter sp.]
MENFSKYTKNFFFFNTTAWLLVKFWFSIILFFEFARVVFILSNYSLFVNAGVSESIKSMWHGLKMDMSMAAYLALPAGLILIMYGFINLPALKKIIKIYTSIILIILLLILTADIFLFKAWGNRIDATPLKYFSNPQEVWASISHLPVFWISLLFVIIAIVLIIIIKFWINNLFKLIAVSKKVIQVVILLILMGALIIPLRGGLQLAPLNQSSVYFSDNNFANQAALNAPLNFMYSINHNENNTENPFVVSSDSAIKITVESLYANRGETEQFLDSTKRLNIILITWESFTGKVIDAKKNDIEITPGYNQLKKEGVFFSNIYASGDRTDKGIVSILSGYPAFATTSIVKTPKKAASLQILGRDFQKHNYSTAFYYGGEPEFANMKAYLMQGGFKKFVTIKD